MSRENSSNNTNLSYFKFNQRIPAAEAARSISFSRFSCKKSGKMWNLKVFIIVILAVIVPSGLGFPAQHRHERELNVGGSPVVVKKDGEVEEEIETYNTNVAPVKGVDDAKGSESQLKNKLGSRKIGGEDSGIPDYFDSIRSNIEEVDPSHLDENSPNAKLLSNTTLKDGTRVIKYRIKVRSESVGEETEQDYSDDRGKTIIKTVTKIIKPDGNVTKTWEKITQRIMFLDEYKKTSRILCQFYQKDGTRVVIYRKKTKKDAHGELRTTDWEDPDPKVYVHTIIKTLAPSGWVNQKTRKIPIRNLAREPNPCPGKHVKKGEHTTPSGNASASPEGETTTVPPTEIAASEVTVEPSESTAEAPLGAVSQQPGMETITAQYGEESSTVPAVTTEGSITTEQEQSSGIPVEEYTVASTVAESAILTSTAPLGESSTTAVTEETSAAPAVVDESSVVPAIVEESSATPTIIEETSAVPVVVEESSAAPAVVEESSTAPAIVEELSATPVIVEESRTSPAIVEESSLAPVIVDESSAAPAILEESSAAPEIVEEPSAAPVIVEESSSAPVIVEEPSAAPAIVEESSAAPVIVEEPSAAPAIVEESSAAPVIVEEPSAAPAIVEESSAAPVIVEEPSAAPEIVEQSSVQPAIVEESSVPSAIVEESSAPPGIVEETSAAPAVVEVSPVVRAIGEESSAAPEVTVGSVTETEATVGESGVQTTPAPADESSAAPGTVEEISTAPLPVEESSAATSQVEDSSSFPLPAEETSSTPSPAEASSTSFPAEESSNSSPAEESSTSSPAEESSTSSPAEESSTSSPPTDITQAIASTQGSSSKWETYTAEPFTTEQVESLSSSSTPEVAPSASTESASLGTSVEPLPSSTPPTEVSESSVEPEVESTTPAEEPPTDETEWFVLWDPSFDGWARVAKIVLSQPADTGDQILYLRTEDGKMFTRRESEIRRRIFRPKIAW